MEGLIMEDKQLIICVKSIDELRAQLGVWASMCLSAQQCIGIKVTVGPAQMEQLFYKIWEAAGDAQFTKWIEAEGFKLK